MRAGLPAAVQPAGISFVPTLPAPATAPSPRVTPGRTIARAATQARVPRRIGRQRALYMMLTGARIDVATALAWGLADGIAA